MQKHPFRDVQCISKKNNSFIKKSVEQSKNKSVKNLIIKKVSHESIVYFILKLSISIRLSTALLLWSKCKIRTSFKTHVSKKTKIWRLKNFFRNDKLLEKITSSSYHMEQKTFIEASYIYNIHTGEKNFCSCCF